MTIKELDAATVKAWLDKGDAILIDVREPAEHARERIVGARLAPLSMLDPAKLDLGGAKRVILHCASGVRSARAAAVLAQAGLGEIANLKGGLTAWKAAGFPTVIDRRAPLPIMRQVQMVAGALIVLGFVLGAIIHPAFHLLSAFVGAGLFLAGATGWCGMALLLARLPYNRLPA